MANIIECCDGSGNEYGADNTYVFETFKLASQDAGQSCTPPESALPGVLDRVSGDSREGKTGYGLWIVEEY